MRVGSLPLRASVLVLLLLCACVERRLFVRTEPPGATVRVNGTEVGTSPVEWRFDHYGTVLVEAELRGHEPVQREHRLKKPLYQQPVLDFVTDVLWPGTIRDDHELQLELRPTPARTEEDVAREAKELEAAAKAMRGGAGGP
jgi:hypothetical protein